MNVLHKVILWMLIVMSTLDIYRDNQTKHICFQPRASQIWLKTDWLRGEGVMGSVCIELKNWGNRYDY